MAEVLQRAHNHRSERVRTFFIHKRLHGLDNLLWFLDGSFCRIAADPTVWGLAILLKRVHANYEMGIEAALADMRDLVFNAMRDVMEIEQLLIDFTHNPDHVAEWLNMPFDKTAKKFRPVELRKREAARLEIEVEDLPTKKDYDAHSRFMHANPFTNLMHPKGVIEPPRSVPGKDLTAEMWLTDSGFWDMYGHGYRIVIAIRDYFSANDITDNEQLFSDEHLRDFLSAYVEVRAMERAFFDTFFPEYQKESR